MKLKKKYIFIPILIALIAFILVMYYVFNRDTYTLTGSDKKWLESNTDQLIDFEYVSDYPVYSGEEGIFQDFFELVESATGLEFNKIPLSKTAKSKAESFSLRVLSSDEKLGKKDYLIDEDAYVVFSKKATKLNSVSDFKNVTLGVFTEDASEISYYLRSGLNLSFKSYNLASEIFDALEKDEIEYAIVPNLMYLNESINKNYNIVHTLTEMNKKIVLTLAPKESKLDSIILKLFNYWKNEAYVQKYNEELFDYYVLANNMTDQEQVDLLSKTYKYGYVENYPYEVSVKNNLMGISGEYLDRVSRLTGVEFEYHKYSTVAELEKAVKDKKIDLFFNYYDLNFEDYNLVDSSFIEQYVVLAKNRHNQVVNTFESLKDKNISMLKQTALFNYFKDNSKAIIKEYSTYDEMLKKTSDELLVVDKEVYTVYRDTKFADYEALYFSTVNKDYNFAVINEEEELFKIFNYVTNTNSFFRYRNTAINKLNASLYEKMSFRQLYILLLAAIFIPLIIIILFVLSFRKKKEKKIVSKEERRKYTDMLTSLKNRNYLNLNIDNWNENTKYPQSIIIIDLNNVKYVNDNYGHEQGDELIAKAAAILVNTQLENSEIIRSDGNEFLIYLVGYSEKQVENYTKKMVKEFKGLPYGFGAALGFTMIEDELMTIDDAINEAAMKMRVNKGEYK